ncbi:MAG: radical SAM protein, partial [Bacteroidota bacterium]
MRKPFHAGMPASLSTEPTTSCNLRCPECPSGLRQFTRPAGQMPEEDFKNIIDQLKDRLAYLLLYFQGEPFLNPDIFKMIRYASKNRIYTTSSTNGHYLEDDNARNIVASGLDRLIISMDGTDQYTYERYRRGGELDRVTDGIQSLVRWKKQLRSSRPYIILQFLVLKTNEHQIPAMKKLAKELQVDRLEFKSAQIYDLEQNHDLIPKNTKY